MHFRNKILAVLLSVMVCVSLFSCKTAPTIADPAPSPAATATPAATPTATPEPTPSPTPSPAQESGSSAFHLGNGDEYGYYNSYFGFGLSKPLDWEYYDRYELNLMNMIEADFDDAKAYEQEYTDRLKSGLVLNDYLGFHDAANEILLVNLRDYSKDEAGVLSEQEVIDFYSETFFDIGGDGTIDARNIRDETFKLGDTERVMKRFELTIGEDAGYGAMVAIPKDSMYAIIIMLCPDEQTLQNMIDSFYVESKYPSIEEFSIPVIDANGYTSKYLELSFQKPAEWEYYSWDELIYINQFNAEKSDEAALTEAYRERFRSGDFVMEYCAFEKDLLHMAYIFTADSIGNKMASASNEEFFQTTLVYLLDFDHDMKIDTEKGVSSEEKLLGQDCLVYRFDDTQGSSGIYGMVVCYRRGTTFVAIELLSGVDGMVDQILPLLRVMGK